MPALGRGNYDRTLVLGAERGQRLSLGLRHSRDFNCLALAVKPVELSSEPPGLDLILVQEKINAERRATDAATGIDARAKHKSQMPRLRRAREARDIHERSEPKILSSSHRQQPLGDEGAIEALERHHIGDGAKRHEIEQAEKIRR